MADVELVIKIPEKVYEARKKKVCMLDEADIAIANGTPLPKGHGKLIDADAYLTKERPRGINEDMWKESHIYKSMTGAPTIIEAEK